MENTSQSNEAMAHRPIGVFDSGVGGLTVARELANQLSHESILYFGDTLRCPYGPRSLPEVKTFARQISSWLAAQDVKLIVIACNSATAAGLEAVQREFEVPVLGVIEPGARAAVQATTARRVGVIGTVATIESGAYTRAIRGLDAGITVFSAATPRFVEMVEQGLRLDRNPVEDIMAQASALYIRPAFAQIARDYLGPLKRCKIDTLVLGCTHYPLLMPLIASIMGAEIKIISSAEETARDVAATLARRGQLMGECRLGEGSGGAQRAAQSGEQRAAQSGTAPVPQAGTTPAAGFQNPAAGTAHPCAAPSAASPHYRFATTAPDLGDFAALGSAIFGRPVASPTSVTIEELEHILREREHHEKEGTA